MLSESRDLAIPLVIEQGDLLFILRRAANANGGANEDVVWQPGDGH